MLNCVDHIHTHEVPISPQMCASTMLFMRDWLSLGEFLQCILKLSYWCLKPTNIKNNVQLQIHLRSHAVIRANWTFLCHPTHSLFTSFEMLCRQNPPHYFLNVYSFTYICMLSAIVLSFAFQPKLYLSAVHVNENAANSRIHFRKAKKREFRAKPVNQFSSSLTQTFLTFYCDYITDYIDALIDLSFEKAGQQLKQQLVVSYVSR